MVETWVVVADGSGCRIFASDVAIQALEPVRELRNDFHANDHRGHAARGHDSAHRETESKFAGEIADAIGRAVESRAARDVLLVAPSRFLGDLLAALSETAARQVTARVAKDLTAVPAHELARRLREALADNHELH